MSGLSPDTRIRPATLPDDDPIDLICRATARGGEPQPDDVADPALVSLVYALPYLALERRTCHVLEDAGTVIGYVVGAVDSADFYRRWTAQWAPRHLPRPVGADPALVSLLADPDRALPPGVERYPSHLHINLLPVARSGGWGGRLLQSFLQTLALAGSPGIHVRVDEGNEAAVRFYRRLGFTVHRRDHTLTMVRELPQPPPSGMTTAALPPSPPLRRR
jgi:ribosomal protein S18 acetylase RimI-like enzyme